MNFLATLVLTAAVLFPYYALSNGTFYLPEESLAMLSFSSDASLENYFTHLFTHVGLQHLVANLLPLILFGLLFESVAGGVHLIAVFILSGLLSSVVFTFINPLVVVVGASTGVSGLMVSTTILKPKKGLVLLIATFFLLTISPPLVAWYNDLQVQKLAEQKAALEEEVQELLEKNQTQEAFAKAERLEKLETTLVQTAIGIQREKETPTDLFVHLLGAFFGGVYVFLFLKQKLDKGLDEFSEIGEFLFSSLMKTKNKS